MVRYTLFGAITASFAIVSSAVVIPRSTLTSNTPLPFQSPSFLPNFPFHGAKPLSPVPTGPITEKSTLDRSQYPEPWENPDINHPEVQRAIKAIDWDHVPKFAPRSERDPEYDYRTDAACWWTKNLCTKPKISYIPADIKYCPNAGDFGLTYDDGPLNPSVDGDPWAEPRLYNFLAAHNQRATLFYVGSNVVNFPEAAKRALLSGHTLSAHTWSHLQMTSLSNEDIVAQLYWCIRAIKEATGVTVSSWRPPFGDVDDRVRAIAYQMGLLTILWDYDSFDWGLASAANDYTSSRSEAQVNSYFEKWISDRSTGDKGHIVLEHETSDKTVSMAEKWLPRLQSKFKVQTVHDCAPELSSPYWETR